MNNVNYAISRSGTKSVNLCLNTLGYYYQEKIGPVSIVHRQTIGRRHSPDSPPQPKIYYTKTKKSQQIFDGFSPRLQI